MANSLIRMCINIRRRRFALLELSAFGFLFLFATFFAALPFSDASIQGLRTIRQVNVSSGGKVNATGTQTGMSAANAMWKENGVIGANGSSLGNAQGSGASNVLSDSYSMVGGQKAEGMNMASANGTNTTSSGMTSSNLNGNTSSIQGSASGKAHGTGDTQVAASGIGRLTNGNQSSPNNGRDTMGTAGASGNQMSSSSVNLGQSMSWFSVWNTMSAISMGKGENNSQANVHLRGGSKANGIAVDGLVSGVNDKGGGSVFSEAVGSGTLSNNSASMQSGLIGALNSSSGGSKMVGASSLSGNNVNNNNSINTFGDLRMNGTGRSQGGLLGNSSVNPDGSVQGAIGIQGYNNGANKSMSVSDGIQSVDGKGPISSIAQSNLQGTGNQAANGTSFVVDHYDSKNGTSMVVGSNGQSMAQNGSGSSLDINNVGRFINGSTNINASSDAQGKVTGQNSQVKGDSVMNLGNTLSGNSNIMASGGGAGPSSAMTNANLNLAGPNGGSDKSSVKGSVNANGDQTYVESISNVNSKSGLSSLFNSQNATVNSKGSAQAQASNFAQLKRRKRHANWQRLKRLARMLKVAMK